MKLKNFIKFGITSRSIKKRFPCDSVLPYNYEIIQEIQDSSYIVWNLEKFLHKLYKAYSYKPLIKFDGNTECFKI